jgi:hypothetical protein
VRVLTAPAFGCGLFQNLSGAAPEKGGIANVELLFALVFEIGDAAPEIKKASAPLWKR